MSMNKKEYAQANKLWLAAKAQEGGVKPLPKGIYYKVLAEGKADGKHPTTRSIVTAHYTVRHWLSVSPTSLKVGSLPCSKCV